MQLTVLGILVFLMIGILANATIFCAKNRSLGAVQYGVILILICIIIRIIMALPQH